MLLALRALVVPLLVVLGAMAWGADERLAPGDGGPVRPGMTPDEVRRRLGPPRRVARQVLYRRYLEQWVYDGPDAVRIEFDCPRGQRPQVLTVQPLLPPKP
jgi:hypothetical protein